MAYIHLIPYLDIFKMSKYLQKNKHTKKIINNYTIIILKTYSITSLFFVYWPLPIFVSWKKLQPALTRNVSSPNIFFALPEHFKHIILFQSEATTEKNNNMIIRSSFVSSSSPKNDEIITATRLITPSLLLCLLHVYVVVPQKHIFQTGCVHHAYTFVWWFTRLFFLKQYFFAVYTCY